MVELRQGGDVPNLPDEPGVYLFVCAFGGHSSYRLGDILYIGVTNSLRRRIAYAFAAPGKSSPHSVQEPLLKFQSRGGVAKVIYCLMDEELPERGLEKAMMEEYRSRMGGLPKWNRAMPRKVVVSKETSQVAAEILDKLSVRRAP